MRIRETSRENSMTMTSTLLEKPAKAATTTARTTNRTTTMAWSNEKLRFSCIDNIGIKQLWKLIALDTNPTTTTTATANSTSTSTSTTKPAANVEVEQQANNNNNNEQQQQLEHHCENLADYLSLQRAAQLSSPHKNNNNNSTTSNHMSLLKFLAINALELSAPASPLLLQQQRHPTQPNGWMQLSGHPESIVPTSSGIVRKRIAGCDDHEVHAYLTISQEPQAARIVPAYYGMRELNGEHYIELQDLLAGFKDPCVMDIKMGCRTFLESEVSNTTLRPDLYKKMVAVDPNEPTAAEHKAQAITKLRYMLFRESLSSSQSKGFRIEALRLRGHSPLKDLKTCRTNEQIAHIIEKFLAPRRSIQTELLKRLKHIRGVIEQSAFFRSHEIVGSSIFIVYDNERVGAWLIDFAKSRPLPEHMYVNHRTEWTPGNREEGLLKGLDELICTFESVGRQRSCLNM